MWNSRISITPRTVAWILAAALAVMLAGGCAPDEDEAIDYTIDPFAGRLVVEPGQGVVPYDLCDFNAPVLGAVTYDDVRDTGIVGFDDEVPTTGGALYNDEFGFLTRGVGCSWFLEDGSMAIAMRPGREVFDTTSEEAGSTTGESFGYTTVVAANRAAALVPADGYGGWTTFAVAYRVDEEVQSLEDQRDATLELLEVFLDQARMAPPTEPEVDVPDWFACELPDSFGSEGFSVADAGEAYGLNDPRDELGIVYTDGVMRCTIWEGRATVDGESVSGDWRTSVSFIFDEEQSEGADPFYWKHELEADVELEAEGAPLSIEISDPDQTPQVSIEAQTSDGRLRVTTRDPDIDREELRRIGLEIMTGILASRP